MESGHHNVTVVSISQCHGGEHCLYRALCEVEKSFDLGPRYTYQQCQA